MSPEILYSIITPSRGDRPNGLAQAIRSVEATIEAAGDLISPEQVEMLVGFDGVQGEQVVDAPFVRYFNLPHDGNYGNAIRNTLLKASRGKRILFLDDDNTLTPNALLSFLAHPDTEMIVGKIDTSKTFDVPFLPRNDEEEPIRQCNIDPLCLCLSRELVVVRCDGWHGVGKYESDYLNILRYFRRARSVEYLEDVVGVYDAGLGLDKKGVSFMQQSRLHRKKGG